MFPHRCRRIPWWRRHDEHARTRYSRLYVPRIRVTDCPNRKIDARATDTVRYDTAPLTRRNNDKRRIKEENLEDIRNDEDE